MFNLSGSFVTALVLSALGLALPPLSYETLYPPIDPEEDQAPLNHDTHTSRPFPYGRSINERTSLTILYQNNLNAFDDQNHVGALLLDPMRQHELRDACEDIGELLLPLSTLADYEEDFRNLFSYLFYTRNETTENQRADYYFRSGVLSVSEDGDFKHHPFPSQNPRLPVLCTQTGFDTKVVSKSKAQRQSVRVYSEGNLYVGSRDQKSFRFLGIPYADPPTRFSYARPYSGNARTIQSKDHGQDCSQGSGGSEDCLYLNIQTPYIPRKDSSVDLRPVLFYIHGGDFSSGSGSDPVTDGGNLASREDIVVVTFNYRLSTLGFLAVPGTDIRGNYGITDQVLALEWTVKNIAQFGGDPRRITLMGEGVGARSVKALLNSHPAAGKFKGAIAMSDRVDNAGLGFKGGEASPNLFPSIIEFYQEAGERILSDTGCDEGTTKQQISCLMELPASTLVDQPTVARQIVQEGNTMPVIFGHSADEGAAFIKYPSGNTQTELDGLQGSLGLSTYQALRILDSGLFPSPKTGDIASDSFEVAKRIATDTRIRCPTQASLSAAVSSGMKNTSYYFETEYTINGSILPYIFGNLDSTRVHDSLHIDTAQLISSYFAEFIRSGQPNPSPKYLAARGHNTTLDVVKAFDSWDPVQDSEGLMHILDFPPEKAPFQDLEQCEFLGFPIDSLPSRING